MSSFRYRDHPRLCGTCVSNKSYSAFRFPPGTIAPSVSNRLRSGYQAPVPSPKRRHGSFTKYLKYHGRSQARGRQSKARRYISHYENQIHPALGRKPYFHQKVPYLKKIYLIVKPGLPPAATLFCPQGNKGRSHCPIFVNITVQPSNIV
jgi:hypothetical protein